MVKTDEPEPVTVDGFKDAETRPGKPLKLRETVPVKPETAETVMEPEPVPPRETCNVVGEAESEKSPAEFTISVTFTVWVSVAVAPVMPRVYVPTDVLAAVVTVSVDEPDPVTEDGAKEPEAPDGKPLTEKLTVSAKPFNALTETV